MVIVLLRYKVALLMYARILVGLGNEDDGTSYVYENKKRHPFIFGLKRQIIRSYRQSQICTLYVPDASRRIQARAVAATLMAQD